MHYSFDSFFKDLLSTIGKSYEQDLSIEQLRLIILKINDYLYTTYDDIGTTKALDTTFSYFSGFHEFWEKYHEKILNAQINVGKCKQIAEILNIINHTNGGKIFYELYDTQTLLPREIAQIRFFAANQDFRGSRDIGDLFRRYIDDPTIFDKNRINQEPEDFLKNIGITDLSQSDKRIKYAITASQILIEKNIDAFDLFEYFNKDLLAVRNFLLTQRGSGFGNKKVDMFIRDMVVLKVWENPISFESIDVASDVNTVSVALRTGILETEIPLVSSFIDIFCYQYSLIDEKNALAWRQVWLEWKALYPQTCIESPSLIDYFVYRIIGKEFCKENLCVFECETKEHTFKWHSSRNKTCQICKKHKAKCISKVLPCSDKEGHIYISKTQFVSGKNALLPNISECPFSKVCNPMSPEFKKLNPPKSISILGRTGWETARVTKGEGGGGLMA
jgi:hypothetical protein